MKIKSAEFARGVKGTESLPEDTLPQIAFVGRSNVGKSSLINALLERGSLARTGAKPGKTMELNFYRVNNAVYFVDLPGYGYAAATLAMREKTRKLILWYLTSGEVRPALVVLIIDIKAGCTDFDLEMLGVLREQKHPYIVVVNKTDRLNQKEAGEQVAQIKEASGEQELFLHSSQTKKGTNTLRDTLFEKLS
jgi:GTP-binding protein